MTEAEGIFPWGDRIRYNSYASYIKRLFGGRVQKLSINTGLGCPNRDGTIGTGGCTYCNNRAFTPSYCHTDLSVSEQIERGIGFHKRRYRKAVGYLAYFQSYSNTHSDRETLYGLYREALDYPDIKGIIVGTRPDCIDSERIDLLSTLSDDHYVSVEIGIESVDDRLLSSVNRGHTYQDSVEAVVRLADAGIPVGAHFILGLPGESHDDIPDYGEVISRLPLTTLKFHQLQIIKDTPMADQYRSDPGGFSLFSFSEYLDLFICLLERLNPDIAVERFTAEAPPDMVIAPRWGLKRLGDIRAALLERMHELDTWQGRLYRP